MSEFQKTKDKFHSLVALYEERGKELGQNETQTRVSLINPFWEALGWDLKDPQQVKMEKEIREHEFDFEGEEKKGTKRADYSFYIGTRNVFAVEAKKPSVNLRDARAIFQIKRYGYTLGIDVGILHDFEEFRPFDTAYPIDKERPEAHLIKEFDIKYNQYPDYAEKLLDTFGREAVLSGSIDRLVHRERKGKPTTPVDKHFLKMLEDWRKALSESLAKNNSNLADHDLNEIVGRILNRIIFLKVVEERQALVENTFEKAWNKYRRQNELKAHIKLYPSLIPFFEEMDDKFNGALFKKSLADDPSLNVPDKPIFEMVNEIYNPFVIYDFAHLPVEMLGAIYEKFLGEVIVADGKKITVEQKPEVRKAGGVYYTPKYIVDYIVENTVGKLIEGKTPEQISKLRILDPACGSGSFLIGAYQKLMDYHLEWFKKNRRKIKRGLNKADAYIDSDGYWRLGFHIKQKILLNNIFGVDIDERAVEVTMLSLYLKLMENETYLTLEGIRYLPDLSDNIKCGNSLIGSDIKKMDFWPKDLEEERALLERIKPFDWEKEFPQVFGASFTSTSSVSEAGSAKDGSVVEPVETTGFDAVIGNPPYVHTRSGLLDEKDKKYWIKTLRTAQGQFDIFNLFIERSINLLKPDGYWSFIQPKRILSNEAFEPIRLFLIENSSITSFLDAGKTFSEANVECCVLASQKTKKRKPIQIYEEKNKNINFSKRFDFDDFAILPNTLFPFSYDLRSVKIAINIIEKSNRLGKYVQITRGFECGMNAPEISKKKNKKDALPLVTGEGVQRYSVNYDGFYANVDWSNKSKWKAEELYTTIPKLLIRFVSPGVIAAYDEIGYCSTNTLYNVHVLENASIFTLLSILNSKLINWWFKLVFLGEENIFPHVQKSQLVLIPIACAKNEKLDKLSLDMLKLHKDLHAEKSESRKKIIEAQIEDRDKQIDELVYELYGLTEEEIKVVEGKD